MTAAHLPGAILTPRYRGARAVASFNAAERHGATTGGANFTIQSSGIWDEAIGSGRNAAEHRGGSTPPCRWANFTPAHQTEQDIARRRFSSVIGCAAFPNAADARSRADRDADNRISARPPSRDITHCPGRSSARPAALFNAVSNAERPSHGCPVGYRDNTGCCASARYTVASTPFARALLPKALAGTRWSAMTAPNSDRQRPARFAAVPCRLPRPFCSL